MLFGRAEFAIVIFSGDGEGRIRVTDTPEK